MQLHGVLAGVGPLWHIEKDRHGLRLVPIQFLEQNPRDFDVPDVRCTECILNRVYCYVVSVGSVAGIVDRGIQLVRLAGM